MGKRPSRDRRLAASQRLGGRGGLGRLAGRMICVKGHRLGGAVDDQHALIAELRHDLVHPRGHFGHPRRGRFAPVAIPHIAYHHRRLVRVPMLDRRDQIELAGTLGRLGAGAETQFQIGGRGGSRQGDKQ